MDSYRFTRRHHRGLPANPWAKLIADWRAALSWGEWKGSLQESLTAAASALECPSQRQREDWNRRGWTTPEAVLRGFIKAQHWVTVRPHSSFSFRRILEPTLFIICRSSLVRLGQSIWFDEASQFLAQSTFSASNFAPRFYSCKATLDCSNTFMDWLHPKKTATA